MDVKIRDEEEARLAARRTATTTGPNGDGHDMTTRATSEQVWRAIEKASFAVIGYVTPSGEPRTSGVVYRVTDGRLYVVVDRDGWKAKHVARNGRVAVTVPVRRGGLASLVAPIPPATISFRATAVVYPPDSPQVRQAVDALGSMLPAERRHSVRVIEIVPEGTFVTYGIGVPLMKMRDTDAARARVPVSSRLRRHT
jgi:hypothetical protein